MFSHRLLRLCVAVASLSCSLTASADVRFVPGGPDYGGNMAAIDIVGTIKKGDYERFLAAYERNKINWKGSGSNPGDGVLVRLNSDGGDVKEAMAIGAKVRETKMSVFRTGDSRCISACVFVLAGGVQRSVFGRVGIHRPYLAVDNATTEAQQKRNYDDIERDIKTYLRHVNVPTSLYDTMFRIAPHEVRFLSKTELQDFGLLGNDPYYEEASTTASAKEMGISKSEYLARKARAEQCEGDMPALGRCISRAYEGK